MWSDEDACQAFFFFFNPGSGNTSLCIENLSSITSCHKYYVVSTLDAFPDDRKVKTGSDRVSNILINKKMKNVFSFY